MAFGINFGASKTSSKGTATIDKTETMFQQGQEGTLASKTGSTSSSGTSSSSGTGSSTSSQTQNQSQTGTNTSTGTSTTSTLSDPVRGKLEQTVMDLLTGVSGAGRALGDAAREAIGGFDPDAFVEGIVGQAAARQQMDVDAELGSIFSGVGGTAGTNSMAALLQNRVQGDAAANLAGIRSQAGAQAAQILQGNLGALTAAEGSRENLLPALTSVLKGASTTQTNTELQQQLQQILGTTAGTTTTAEQSTQQQQQQSVSVEDLAQLVSQIMSGTTNTKGTETQKTKGKGMNFGISLSSGQ